MGLKQHNTNISLNPYNQWCYDNKKFAFLSDYIRLIVIEEYGGIYFDTDVEVIRAFDDILDFKAFFGFETNEFVNTGVGFGAEAHNPIVEQMIKNIKMFLAFVRQLNQMTLPKMIMFLHRVDMLAQLNRKMTVNHMKLK